MRLRIYRPQRLRCRSQVLQWLTSGTSMVASLTTTRECHAYADFRRYSPIETHPRPSTKRQPSTPYSIPDAELGDQRDDQTTCCRASQRLLPNAVTAGLPFLHLANSRHLQKHGQGGCIHPTKVLSLACTPYVKHLCTEYTRQNCSSQFQFLNETSCRHRLASQSAEISDAAISTILAELAS